MALVKSVCRAMEHIAPLRLAEKWDNGDFEPGEASSEEVGQLSSRNLSKRTHQLIYLSADSEEEISDLKEDE